MKGCCHVATSWCWCMTFNSAAVAREDLNIIWGLSQDCYLKLQREHYYNSSKLTHKQVNGWTTHCMNWESYTMVASFICFSADAHHLRSNRKKDIEHQIQRNWILTNLVMFLAENKAEEKNHHFPQSPTSWSSSHTGRQPWQCSLPRSWLAWARAVWPQHSGDLFEAPKFGLIVHWKLVKGHWQTT